ncbi:uncharacterized protein METZ01_LOCUS468832, partial [marine metagenome]
HLGIASKGVTVSSDLIGPGLMADDVTAPRLTYQNGHLRAPRGKGLGLDLVPALVEKYRKP